MKLTRLFVLLQYLITFPAVLYAGEYLIQADSLFDTRFKSFDPETILTDSVIINKAMRLYQTAINNEQPAGEKYEAVLKLLQVYYFKGNFTTDNMEEKRDIFTRGIEFGEKYVHMYPDSVAIHCWLGILWGYWGEVHSSFASARKGVPGKVKFYAERTIELDEHYLDAGGYRMLGRLHYMVPKIPLLMGWPSKDKSLTYLKKAHELAPENLLNKLYLAETLYVKENKKQAKQMLEEIVNTEEIIHDIIIDTWIKQQATQSLQKLYPKEEK